MRKLCNFEKIMQFCKHRNSISPVGSRRCEFYNYLKISFWNPCGRTDYFEMFLLDFTSIPPRLYFLINGCQGRWAQAEFMHGRICRFLFPIWFVFVFFWFANMYFHTFQIKYLRAYLHLWICISSSADLSPIAISAVAKIDRSQVLDSILILILISPFPRLRPPSLDWYHDDCRKDDDDWWWWWWW